jgi:hypothetical protein
MFLLRNVRLTFLDFDSVIKNSVEVKTVAFSQFLSRGCEGALDAHQAGSTGGRYGRPEEGRESDTSTLIAGGRFAET